MPVEETKRDIGTLIGQVTSGEIRLPEIQRGYVWKPTQVAKMVDSLYRGYPFGSLLLWRTTEAPQTRELAVGSTPDGSPVPPLFLLDGQQRLTSLHRVFTDHPDAQIVFNVDTEHFQNQSAATAKDARWIKVHEVLREDADLFEIQRKLLEAGIQTGSWDLGRRLNKLGAIPKRTFHMEILAGFGYEEVAQIFVRVNSGRALKTSDLALATLSARWPGVLTKLEDEAEHWATRHYGDLDVTFLTRALTGAVLGRGLSTWSHGRLAAASDDELEQGWETVQRGLRHLVPLLQQNLRITSSALITSHISLLPLIVLLGERPDAPLEAETRDGILYWFLLAGLRNRYSSSTDTRLGQDIPAAREPEPVRRLLTNLGVVGSHVEVTPQDLVGKTRESAYFTLSYLVAKDAGAKDWWFGTEISATAEGAQRLEYHHIHPQATLKDHPKKYSKAEINDLANLAFISGRANRTISDRSPSVYFVDTRLPPLTREELRAHFVPFDVPLRDAAAYREFLTARRKLLATAMTELLDRFRPSWLDQSADRVEQQPGCSLRFELYRSSWDIGRMVATAKGDDPELTFEWTGSFVFDDLVTAIDQADNGTDGDIEIAGEPAPVRVENDTVEIAVGPYLVTGTITAWREMMEREEQDARPLSELPEFEEIPWTEDRLPFPVTSVE
ncbi:hypothetical protein BZB76_3886 [Actinomadura pelletieri DSM 43383]|uniref:GmrSD restriction endonucleases N-terminal domain-containing protein n=1 Tax=Actinomadura pelletieri DSM 43383 TaxID=1120940 RepID=A0A495QL24_9ACTN|nr:DUF262 domain-containing protein [Actinomadura pelletieri]RKS73196.1 hypothetical protein BZB76_3886 [Actinomadura pelletieri DSM 43383]